MSNTTLSEKVVIDLKGKLDANVAPDLEEMILDRLKKRERAIYFDFSRVETIRSSCLGVLAAMNEEAAKIGTRLIVCNVNDKVAHLFEVAKLDRLLGGEEECGNL